MNKKKYKTIGEVARELNLIDKETGKLQTHTIRYWETQFKQIKPIIMTGNRRYYSNKNIKILYYIKSLLKEKFEGHSINFEYFDCSDIELIEKNLEIVNKKYGCPDVFINCSWPRSKDFAKNNFSDIKLSSLR